MALTDIERLLAKARAATPGEWKVRSHPKMQSFVQAPRLLPSHPYDIDILGEDETLYATREADLEYITATCPVNLIPLLEELEDLRFRMKGLEK